MLLYFHKCSPRGNLTPWRSELQGGMVGEGEGWELGLVFKIKKIKNGIVSSLNFSVKMLKRLSPFHVFNLPVSLNIVSLSLVITIEPELTLELAKAHDQFSSTEL